MSNVDQQKLYVIVGLSGLLLYCRVKYSTMKATGSCTATAPILFFLQFTYFIAKHPTTNQQNPIVCWSGLSHLTNGSVASCGSFINVHQDKSFIGEILICTVDPAQADC